MNNWKCPAIYPRLNPSGSFRIFPSCSFISVSDDPMRKLPDGMTAILGQSGQSWNVYPAARLCALDLPTGNTAATTASATMSTVAHTLAVGLNMPNVVAPSFLHRRYKNSSYPQGKAYNRASAARNNRAKRSAQAVCPAASTIRSWRISISTCTNPRPSACVGTL